MLSEQILTALQFQLSHEITNAYTYKMFSGIADYQGLIGATSWFAKQSDEEKSHFEKIFTYICDQGHVPHLLQIPEIIPENLSLVELFARSCELEFQTTAYLKLLAQLCKQENDDQTYTFIQGMLIEQVEEERYCGDMHKRVCLSQGNLILIDQELGQR